MSCCHERFMIHIYMCSVAGTLTTVTRLGRVGFATGINHVSPRILGSCFGCEDE
jgi:hypothetical protein